MGFCCPYSLSLKGTKNRDFEHVLDIKNVEAEM